MRKRLQWLLFPFLLLFLVPSNLAAQKKDLPKKTAVGDIVAFTENDTKDMNSLEQRAGEKLLSCGASHYFFIGGSGIYLKEIASVSQSDAETKQYFIPMDTIRTKIVNKKEVPEVKSVWSKGTVESHIHLNAKDFEAAKSCLPPPT